MFNRDLYINSFGKDVKELQKILTKMGFGSFMATGYFGTKTWDAVKSFQKAYKIEPALGFFGPITRAKINEILSDTNREHLYYVAKECVGTDVTPEDLVPDEVDCADTVCTILNLAGFDIGYYPYTLNLYKALKNSPHWIQIFDNYKRGDVIISPTSLGNGTITGHTGFISDNGKIISNSSSDGIVRENYTLDTWRKRYVEKGGLPLFVFRKL